MEERTRPPLIDYISVFAFLVLLALCSWQLVQAFSDVGFSSLSITLLVMGGVTFISYLAADFLSGFVHFLGDSFGDIDTPILGKEFIFPFREHHVDQKAITRHDFFVTNGHNCLVSIPALLFTFIVFPRLSPSPTTFLLDLFIVTLVLFVFGTNQFHKWAHEDHPNALARFLQSYGLILSPVRHRKHHTAPFASHFCITTGWLNELLEKIHFFPAAKRTLAKVPGMPKVYEPENL